MKHSCCDSSVAWWLGTATQTRHSKAVPLRRVTTMPSCYRAVIWPTVFYPLVTDQCPSPRCHPPVVFHPDVTNRCLSPRCHLPMSFTQVSPTSCLSPRCHPPVVFHPGITHQLSFTQVSPTDVFHPSVTHQCLSPMCHAPVVFHPGITHQCLSPRCHPPVVFHPGVTHQLSFTQASPTNVFHPGVTHQLSFTQVSPTSCLSPGVTLQCLSPWCHPQCLSPRCHPPVVFHQVSPTSVFHPGVTHSVFHPGVSAVSTRSDPTCLTPSLPQPVTFTGWKVHAHACKWYIFWSYSKSTFNTACFDKKSFHMLLQKRQKKKKRPNVLNFCTFIGPFSNDIMAVKGLMLTFHLMAHPPEEQNYSFFIKNTYFFFLFNWFRTGCIFSLECIHLKMIFFFQSLFIHLFNQLFIYF